MSERVIGYILIAVGIGTIIFSLFAGWMVFTGKSTPPQIFKSQGISLTLPQINQKTELLSADLVNRPLNMTMYLLFLGLVATGGMKVATIGTQLVRIIKVEVKS